MIMNKEILYEILKSKSETLSSAEIESILNEELDKSSDEMDTDLVDLCLEALNTVDEKKLNIRKHKIKFSKILIAAVIFVTAIIITIPVCAKYLNINVPEGMVTIYKECFNIDISKDVLIDDVFGQLEQDGINDIVLPKLVFYPNTQNCNYTKESMENYTMYGFDFIDDDITGHVTLQAYNDSYEFVVGNKKVSSSYEKIEYFEVNELTVLVFYNDDTSYINYSNNNTEYNIVINCDYETACQIAKTI